MEISYAKIAIRKELHNTNRINRIIYKSNNPTGLTGSILIPIIQQGLYISISKTKNINSIYLRLLPFS